MSEQEIVKLLSQLRRADIKLELNQGKLKVNAPKGALTDDIKSQLKEHRDALLAFLSQREQKAQAREIIQKASEQKKREGIPATDSQARFWFLDKFSPGDPAFNIPAVVEIRGELDLDLFQKSLHRLLARHESLRMAFTDRDGEAYIAIQENPDWQLETKDCVIESPEEFEVYIKSESQRILSQGFDLEAAPLMRASLHRIEKNYQDEDTRKHYILFTCIHHIVCDGWSIDIILRDLSTIYLALLQGQQSVDGLLPEIPVEFSDYALWQSEESQKENSKALIDFWKEKLQGAKSLLPFPYDRVRTAKPSSAGESFVFGFSKDESKKITQLCKSLGLTPFMFFIGVYQLCLARYTKSDDVSIGVPIAGRTRQELENIVGLFLNAIIIRTSVDYKIDQRVFFEKLRSIVLEAYDHQDLAIDQLIDHLDIDREHEEVPGVQFAFIFQNAHDDNNFSHLQGNGNDALSLRPMSLNTQSSKHDICLTMSGNEKSYQANIEYRSALLDEKTVENFAQHFHQFVNELVDSFESKGMASPLSDLKLFKEEQLKSQLAISEPVDAIRSLTKSQQGFYLNDLIREDNQSTLIGTSVLINGKLDVEAWKNAIVKLTEQRAVLRMQIIPGSEKLHELAYQVIFKNADVDFEILDGTGWSLEEAQEKAKQIIYTPFQLQGAYLIRYRLIQLAADQYVFVSSMHHTLMDAVSALQLWVELQAIYEGDAIEVDNYIEYLDYAESHIDNADLLKHWQKQLAGVATPDYSVHGKASDTGFHEHGQRQLKRLMVQGESWNAVKRYCRQQGITPAILYKVVFAYLVECYCQTESKFLIHEIITGRPGVFSKTLGNCFLIQPFIFDSELFNREDTAKVFSAAKQQQKQNKAYSALSQQAFEAMQNKGRLAFFYNYLTFMPPKDFLGEVVDFRDWGNEIDEAVEFNPRLGPDGLELNLFYREALFRENGFLESVQGIVEQLIQGREHFSQFSLSSSAAPISELIAEPNEAQNDVTEAKDNVVQRFLSHAKTASDATAVVFHERRVSYAELEQASAQVANFLKTKSIDKGDLVAIEMEKSIEFVAALLGVLRAGGQYLPLDPELPEERKNYIKENSQARVSIDKSCLEEIQACTTVFADEEISLHAPAYTIYTSGSTGVPKGVQVSHGPLIRTYLGWQDKFELCSADKHLQMASIGFDVFTGDWVRALCSGASLYLVDKQQLMDPEALVVIMTEEKISVAEFVPAVLRMVLQLCTERAIKLTPRLLMVGSDAWFENDQTLLESCVDTRCSLVNSYGVTEAVIDSSYEMLKLESQESLSQTEKHSVSIGKPFPNTALYILDHHRRLLPQEVSGELYIAGADIADGYVNDEEKTQQAFLVDTISTSAKLTGFLSGPNGEIQRRMYRTGDRAKLCQNGDLVLLGRIGQQVKIRGFRVELGEIENQLKALPEVDECVVLVRERNQQDFLVAYLVFHSETHLELANIRSRLSRQLPDYMLPQFVIRLESIPLNANGKLDRKALPEPDFENIESRENIAPRNPLEQELLEIWQSVLGIENISVLDNFFELGGHSLLATQLVSRIKQSFNRELAIKSIFEHPSISEQAGELEQLLRKDDKLMVPPVEAVERKALMPASYAQQRFWFLDRLVPGFFAYNMPFGMKLYGKFQVDVFGKALTEVLRRHESLRSHFVSEQDCVYAKISEAQGFPISFEDLRHYGRKEKEEHVNNLIQENAHKPFDLENDLLIRCSVLQIDDEAFLLLGCMHHIISDGWSIRILFQELAILYNAFSLGRPSPLPEPLLQYPDFAAWEQSWLQGEVLQDYTDFWLKELEGAPEILKLPTDKPRPQAQTFNGKQLSLTLPLSFKQELEKFCSQQNISLFMLLMAAMAILMSRYTKEKDILIGTPVAGRNQLESENMIGLFLNAVIIRSRLESNPSVEMFLQSVRERCLSAFAYQEMPAEILYERVANHRNPQYPAGAQVGLVLQNTETQQNSLDAKKFGEHLQGLSAELLGTEQVISNYDFGFTVIEQDKGLEIIAEFNTDLFVDGTIQTLLEQYVYLLEQMQRDSQQAIDSLSVLPESKLLKTLGLDESLYKEALPLTAMQEGMFFANKLNPFSREYGVGFTVRIQQAIDLDLWTASLQGLIDTQDVTRVVFKENDIPYLDPVYQVILKEKKAHVEYIDWSQEKRSEKEIEEFASQFINHPYNVLKDDLMRVMLIKVSDDYFVGVFGAHHILLDGIAVVAFGVMGAMNYELVHNGGQAIVHEDKYRDYLLQSQKEMDTWEVQAFWQEELQNPERALEALEYPVNSRALMNPAQAAQKQKKSLTLPAQHWQLIQLFCKQNRITPALYFKALYALVLSKYCRSEQDFYIFEILAGRPAGHMNALGCYFQQIPIVLPRESFAQQATIRDIFQSLRQAQKRSKRKQSISVPAQMAMLPEAPVNFMYNFEHYIPDFYFMGKPVAIQEYSNQVNGLVQLLVKTLPDSVQLNLQSQEAFFDDFSMLERIESLSERIVAGEQNLSALDLLSESEQAQLLQQLQGPQVAVSPLTVTGLIERSVQQFPDNLALQDSHGSLTYRELDQKANQLAQLLIEKGVTPGDCVGICLPLCKEVSLALLAILKTGAAYLPMDSAYPEERLEYFIEDAKPKLVLTLSGLINQCFANSQYRHILYPLETEALQAYPAQKPRLEENQQSLIYKLYTSGSTGNPNCTATYHDCEVNLLEWYCNTFSLSEKDKVLLISALGFDLTQKNLMAPLLKGACIHFYNLAHYDAPSIKNIINSQKISWLNCAPSAFYPLVENKNGAEFLEGDGLKSLRKVFLGGEAIQYERLANWYENTNRQCDLVNTYGPSECTDISSFHVLERKNYVSVPIGKPNNNVNLYVLDQHKHLQVPGLPGELYVGGAGVGAEYLNNESLSQQRFTKNPFHSGRIYKTGDLVRITDNYELDYIGRSDFQIKVRGIRIEPGEIESHLKRFDAVKDAVVIQRNEKLLAYVVSPESLNNPEFLQEGLQSELRRHLNPSLIPDAILLMESFPLNPNGKVDRRALPDISQEQRPFVAPETETEQQLADIWKALLNIETVSRYDNFFEIGGHSLLAVQLMSNISRGFQIELPLATLFEAQTLDSLAIKIDSASSENWSALVNIKQEGDRQLFCIHPVGGEVLCYRDLARQLGNAFSVQAIQARGLLSDQEYISEAGDMLKVYADLIEEASSNEHIYLAGQSIGGVFALAIAEELRRRGKQVAMLALFDSFVPSDENLEQIGISHLSSALGAFMQVEEGNLQSLNELDQLRHLFEQAKSAYLIPQEIHFEDVSRRFLLAQANISIARQLQFGKVTGLPCLHFEAEESLSGRASSNGWQDIIPDVSMHTVRGNHESMMSAENIKSVSQTILHFVNPTASDDFEKGSSDD